MVKRFAKYKTMPLFLLFGFLFALEKLFFIKYGVYFNTYGFIIDIFNEIKNISVVIRLNFLKDFIHLF